MNRYKIHTALKPYFAPYSQNQIPIVKALLVLVLLSLSFTPRAFAVPAPVLSALAKLVKPSITITSPHNGEPIYYDVVNQNTSRFYDPPTESALIFGVFKNVQNVLFKHGFIAIRINGEVTPATITLYPRLTHIGGTVFRSGFFSQRIVVPFNLDWPMRNFTAELINVKTQRVIARSRMALYDLRGHSDATPYEAKDAHFLGMSSQLADTGVGQLETNDTIAGLEPIFQEQLPYPNFDSFNDTLTTRARNISRYDDDTNQLGACIEYGSLTDPHFWNPLEFGPYAEAYAAAIAIEVAYKAEKKICDDLPAVDPVTIAAKAACYLQTELTYCVKSKPEKDDFELCTDQIEGDVQSYQISGVSDVSLRFQSGSGGKHGFIDSNISVNGLKGRVTGYLRSLSVRWKGGACLVRPRGNLDDSTIQDQNKQWLNDWATCHNLEVNNTLATTSTNDMHGVYEVKQDASLTERPQVTLSTAGEFSFTGGSVNANKETCALSFVNTAATDMLKTFREPLHTRLQNTWYNDSPDTQEAVVLTKMLSPYRLGEIAHSNYDVLALLNTVSSQPLSGLRFKWMNSASTTDPLLLKNLKPQWFYAPPRDQIFSEDALDHHDHKFDSSFTVTTGLLNKILNVRSASPTALYFTYHPTWAELAPYGVVTPPGKSANDPATLNQATLSHFDPAFKGFGKKQLEIAIRPIFDPIVYMPPDYTEEDKVDGIGAPTVYGINSLQILFKEKDRIVRGKTIVGKTWLRLLGGFTDQDFSFTLDKKEHGQYLSPHLKHDMWGFSVTNSNLTGCAMYINDAAHIGTCEDRLEDRVSLLISDRLRSTFVDLLSEVPAPQFFDSAGEASVTFFFDPQSREQSNQNITFYGKLDLS